MYGDVGDARSLEEHSGDAGDSRIALEVRIKANCSRRWVEAWARGAVAMAVAVDASPTDSLGVANPLHVQANEGPHWIIETGALVEANPLNMRSKALHTATLRRPSKP
ncbi:hypothetical protein CTheo_8131 [Ceratobasidium theobromae]|uniref:Uncharacterized protein n=1 Tax=Ceratobasidium theobromae TaxID=1582974 RepID=A0A5N5QAK9_9AGAM|nr:hypothetical protein CTheo_8131 [Ceratobasidium theobromae]